MAGVRRGRNVFIDCALLRSVIYTMLFGLKMYIPVGSGFLAIMQIPGLPSERVCGESDHGAATAFVAGP